MLTTLLLTTKGRKSGEQQMIPLICKPTGDGGFCVIASKGGAPSHPAWSMNPKADPAVHAKVANEEFKAMARVAEGDERERLWNAMVDYYALYTDYQASTESLIPVMLLDPA